MENLCGQIVLSWARVELGGDLVRTLRLERFLRASLHMLSVIRMVTRVIL